MELLLKPLDGIGPLKLGLSRKAFHNSIGGKFETFPPAKGRVDLPDTPLTDYFYDYDAKVEYDRHERTMFIEVGPKFPVVFEGQNLFDLSYQELISFFVARDPELVLEDVGFTSMKFHIAVYAPEGVQDSRVPCELVSVFVKGYYEADLY
jgi:hypothetical protein